MLKVAIIGASGYTGMELLRILRRHSHAEVVAATSRQYAGRKVSEVIPSFRGFYDNLRFSEPAGFSALNADFFFTALPHGEGMSVIAKLPKKSRIVDLSADFRLPLAVYEKWYGPHKGKTLLKKAVYGIPELFREQIEDARLVANPGCYPTAAALALSPLLSDGVTDASSIVIDSKSGVSGAGRAPLPDTSFVETAGGFKPYRVFSHRHTPEIEYTLSRVAGEKISVIFTPHLLPVSRGILSTAYITLKKPLRTKALLRIYRRFYEGERFIRIRPEDDFPNIRDVRGSNFCDIGLKSQGKRLIVVSAIDNLVKGASGQAVQNMNIMCGFPEGTALDAPPLCI